MPAGRVLGLKLTEDEEKTIVAIHARRQELVKYDQTIESLVRSWRILIQDVETGYGSSIFEYTNDVSSRQVLDQLLPEMPERVRQKLADILAPLDNRFLQLTEEPRLSAECPNLPGLENDKWARIPKQQRGQLLKDLTDYGLSG